MPYLWQFKVVVFTKKTLVSGVILRRNPDFEDNTTLQHFFKVISTYFHSPLKHIEFQMQIGKDKITCETDANGGFSFVFDEQIKKVDQVKLISDNWEITLACNDFYYGYSDSHVDIISDIDDTIMVSHTASHVKRIATLIGVKSKKRRAISFSKAILKFYHNKGSRVLYVSKSESNLHVLIRSIMRIQELPKGPLFLTNFLKFIPLLTLSKKKDFKWDHISFIIQNSDEKKFVLLGDDTQLDMAVYLKTIKTYPDRIKGIYIHKTGLYLNQSKRKVLNELKQKFPMLVYFRTNEEWNPNVI